MQIRCLFAVLLTAIIFLATGCSETRKHPDPLMADLDATDSTEILYFRSPDSVRYFTYLPTKDQEFIDAVKSNLRQDTVPPIACMKEGKIYLFRNGAIFNTVFFGYLDKECRFLRFIRNGNLYHYSLSPELEKKLISFKSAAREPTPATGN